MHKSAVRLFLLVIVSFTLLLTACGADPTATPAPAAAGNQGASVGGSGGGGSNFATSAITTQAAAVAPAKIATAGCLPEVTTAGPLVQACVSEPAPKQNTNVTLYARLILDAKPVPNAKMESDWKYKFFPSTCTSATDSNGVASCTKNIGDATKDFTVVIDVKFKQANQTYTASTSFITEPKSAPATATTAAPAAQTTVAVSNVNPTAATTAAAVTTLAPAATTAPTATALPIVATKEWGVVKPGGADVRTAPDAKAASITKLQGFTLVAWQNKLQDGTWYERAGGGWIAATTVNIFATEAEARNSLPQPPTTAPAPAVKQTTAAARVQTAESAPCLQGQIKGNLNSMIYHPPSGRDYAKTHVNVVCFDTAAQAEAAGFRASKV